MKNEINVCGVCVTYNHEKYVKEALEGFIKQEVDFKFKVIIADDHSQDATRDVLIEYQKKYPDVIDLILRDHNLGAMDNWLDVLRRCEGDYIALCEGDDSWTDPHKLQKQIDFLEENPDFVMCSHKVKTIFEGVEEDDPFVKPMEIATFEDIVEYGHFIPALSIVFRRSALPEIPDWFKELISGDIPLILLLIGVGKNYYIDEEMGIKRKHPGGITQDPRRKNLDFHEFRRKKEIFLYERLDEHFNYEYHRVIKRKLSKHHFKLMKIYFKKRDLRHCMFQMLKSFYYSPMTFIAKMVL